MDGHVLMPITSSPFSPLGCRELYLGTEHLEFLCENIETVSEAGHALLNAQHPEGYRYKVKAWNDTV